MKEPEKTKQAKVRDERDERIVAKYQLVTLLRSNKTVFTFLQLPRNAADEALVKALAKFDSSFDALRGCGYSVAEASRAGELLKLALEAPAKKSKKKDKANDNLKFMLQVVVTLLLLTLLCMVGALVWTASTATAGWMVGSCTITMFSNKTCHLGPRRCAVELMVKGSAAWVVKKDWSLPVVSSTLGNSEFLKYDTEPLRCCNTQPRGKAAGVDTCCSLRDEDTQQFCDKWGYRNDYHGKPCPPGNWRCLYKLDAVDQSIVTEVVPYVAPNLTPLKAGIATIVSFLCSGLVMFLLQRAGIEMNCCCKRKFPSWLKKVIKNIDADLNLSSSDEEDEPGDSPRMKTTEENDEQNEKRPSASKLEPLSVVDIEENQSELVDSRKRSKRKNSTLSGSSRSTSKLSESSRYTASSKRRVSISEHSRSTASSKRRDSISEHRSLNNPAGLPGVVEYDETVTEAESMPARKQDKDGAKVTRYLSWEALNNHHDHLDEDDIHASFKHGDLSQLAAMAERTIQEHCVGLLGEKMEP